MIPYYILKTDKFDLTKNFYSTCSQKGLPGVQDDDPCTTFKKHEIQIINDLIKYDLTCETIFKRKGRAYGYNDIFSKFILIDEKTFYYNDNLKIIIMSATKEVFNKFFLDFKDDSYFSFSKINVDFTNIIQNQYQLGIEGIWLGQIPDVNLNSLLLLGRRIENSSQYRQLIAQGAEITNISIIYNFNNQQEKVMITKEGGIILYHRKDETDALMLVEDIYKKLLIP